MKAVRLVSRALVLLALAPLGFVGCGKKKDADAPVGASSVPAPPLPKGPLAFSFDSLDDRPVSSVAAKGKVAVITFVTTWDLQSQAQVNFLTSMSKHDGGKVFYAVVATQDQADRELIEAYAKALAIDFPVALADAETMAGRGPFADVSQIPTTMILDREGTVVWRKTGIAKSDELRDVMSRLR